MASNLHANLSIAIKTIGAQKLDVLRKGLGATAQSALALERTYSKLGAAQGRLQKFQAAAAKQSVFARGFDKTASTMSGVGDGFNKFLTVGSKMFLTGQLIASSFRAVAGAAEMMLNPVKEFQSAMAQVRIKGGFNAEQTARLADQAKQLGRTTTFGPTQAAQAQVALAASGLSEEQIAANTPTVLKFAQATGMGADESSDYLVNVARQFQMDLNDPNTLNRVGSAIKNAADASTISERDLQQTLKYAGPIAKAAGYGVSEAAAMAAIMGNSGLKGSQSGTGLRNLFSSFAKPKGGKVTDGLLGEIGITREDLNKNIEDIPNFLELMEDRMLGKGFDKGKRIALAASLFGQYGMTAALVLQQAAGSSADVLVNGINSMVQAVNGNLDSLDTAAAIRGSTMEGKMDSLNARWETFRITVGEALAPTIIQALDQITAKVAVWEEQARTDPAFLETLKNVSLLFQQLPAFIEIAVAALKGFNAVFGAFLDVYKAFGGDNGSKLSQRSQAQAEEEAGEQRYRDRILKAKGLWVDPASNMSGADLPGLASVPDSGYSDDPGMSSPDGPYIPEIPTVETISEIMSPYMEQLAMSQAEPSVLDVHITTDSGTKATVTSIKAGAVKPRVSTNAAP